MPKASFTANSKSFKCNNFPGENTAIYGPVIDNYHDQYSFIERPDSLSLIIQRDILLEKKVKDKNSTEAGELTLLSILAHSRVWDNKKNSKQNWPTSEIFFDSESGNSTIDSHKIDLERIFIDQWELNWEKNSTFQERIYLRAHNLKMTSLKNNKTVELSLV